MLTQIFNFRNLNEKWETVNELNIESPNETA